MIRLVATILAESIYPYIEPWTKMKSKPQESLCKSLTDFQLSDKVTNFSQMALD